MTEDNRETIELDLTDEEFLTIAKWAHEADITWNEMVVRMLTEFLEGHNDEE